jgi:hypothetical protein
LLPPLVEKNFLVFTRGTRGNYSKPRFREKQGNFFGKNFFLVFMRAKAIIRQFLVLEKKKVMTFFENQLVAVS